MRVTFYDQVAVAARTSNFVMLKLAHVSGDFESFEDFVEYLYASGLKNSCGYNKNKKGYMETLRFLYDLYYNKKGGEII